MVRQYGNMFLPGEFSGGQVSWATANPWTRKLGFGELQLDWRHIFNWFFAFSILYVKATVAPNNLVSGLKFLTNWCTSPPLSKPAPRLRPWEWAPTAQVLAHLPLVVESLKKGAVQWVGSSFYVLFPLEVTFQLGV